MIEAKVKETAGSEYCQARLYHTIDDLDGDGREDFVLVFSVEAAAGGNDSVQYLAVFPSATQWAPVIVKVGQRGERYIDNIEVDAGDPSAVALTGASFGEGGLPRDSFVRPGNSSLQASRLSSAH